jgi:hypothetical protein
MIVKDVMPVLLAPAVFNEGNINKHTYKVVAQYSFCKIYWCNRVQNFRLFNYSKTFYGTFSK